MRRMRPNSRMTMVQKPIQRIDARDASEVGTGKRLSSMSASGSSARGARFGCAVLHQAHEDLLEPVDLVAHAEDFDAEPRQLRKQVVQALLLRQLHLDRVVIDRTRDDAWQHWRPADRLTRVQHEGFRL